MGKALESTLRRALLHRTRHHMEGNMKKTGDLFYVAASVHCPPKISKRIPKRHCGVLQ